MRTLGVTARRFDPARFSREYEAEFSEDVESFLAHGWVEAAIAPGRHELPPLDNTTYFGVTEPAGAEVTPSRSASSTWNPMAVWSKTS